MQSSQKNLTANHRNLLLLLSSPLENVSGVSCAWEGDEIVVWRFDFGECKGHWNSLAKELSNSRWAISLHQVNCVRAFFCPARSILFFWFILWGYNFWQPTNYFDYFWRLKIKWQKQICCKPADILMHHYLARSSLWVDSQNLLEILENSCITLNK